MILMILILLGWMETVQEQEERLSLSSDSIFPTFYSEKIPGPVDDLDIGEGKKAAYKNHFKGTLYFKGGEFKKALQHFQKAYSSAPSNIYFGMSYGVSLAQMGKYEKGLSVLESVRGESGMNEITKEGMALLAFFTGMIHSFGASYEQAIPNFKSSIKILEQLDNDRLVSLVYNALGHALILDQGKGGHSRRGLGLHYHVHTRDLLRAKVYFEKALETNGSNAAAWYNYSLVCDSLELEPKFTFDSSGIYEDLFTASTPSLSDLPTSILSAYDFEVFDEILMMLDNSGSMVQEKIQCQDTTRFAVMKETALELLKQIPFEKQLGIGTIGGDCADEPRLWHSTGSMGRRDFRYAIEFLVPDGTTPLLTMLQRTDELFSKNPSTHKVMFLVSDGANVCSAAGIDICEWAEKLAGRNITIHILTFLNATFANTNAFAEYACLAEKTNGDILFLDDLNCNVKYHPNTPIQECQPKIPHFERVDCWGKSFRNLWAIFPE